jgi:hypothetical protein
MLNIVDGKFRSLEELLPSSKKGKFSSGRALDDWQIIVILLGFDVGINIKSGLFKFSPHSYGPAFALG